MKSIYPHTAETVAEFKTWSDDEVKKAIEKSWDCFQTYKNSSVKERKDKFSKLADIIKQNQQKYAETITKEMGKAVTESLEEVQMTIDHCRYIADNLEKMTKSDEIKTSAKQCLVEYQPLGVIYIIGPYNFPFYLVFLSGGFAMAVGNTLVCKVASQCPLVGKCIEEAMQQAGFTNGEFQLLMVSKEQSELIISDPHVMGVGFTGSTKGGATIASIAGKHCKKSVMELGGSDPCIVLKDADQGVAIDVAIKSRLMNGGQVCNSAKRFLIDESIYDQFKKKLVDSVSKVKVGDPMKKETKMGPLSSKKTVDNLVKQMEKGVGQGARVLYGGKKPEGSEYEKGFYFMPTVVEIDNQENVLAQEEVFGPVLVLMKYKDEGEIPKLANNTEYGLTAIIISKDTERAHKLSREIDCGGVYINAPVRTVPEIPFGGIKKSGFGREGGPESWHEFANVKTVWIEQP